jgi:pyruvate dehydrogenase (quinone)
MAWDAADGMWEMLVAAGVRRWRPPGRPADGPALAHTDGPVVLDVVVDRYALSLPSHVPAKTAEGFTPSLAKQVLTGKMDNVIETVEHNVRLLQPRLAAAARAG